MSSFKGKCFGKIQKLLKIVNIYYRSHSYKVSIELLMKIVLWNKRKYQTKENMTRNNKIQKHRNRVKKKNKIKTVLHAVHCAMHTMHIFRFIHICFINGFNHVKVLLDIWHIFQLYVLIHSLAHTELIVANFHESFSFDHQTVWVIESSILFTFWIERIWFT